MEIDGLEMQEIDNIFNDAYKKTTTLREAWRYAMMRYAEIYHDREVKKLNEPAVSKCEEFEREASCKHSDWTDLYYSSGDYYGRYCNDCGEFFE